MQIILRQVASFAEAWIEILLSSSRLCRCIPSPPSRRRGLKFFLPPLLRRYSLSPPSRRRGLKYSVTPEKLLTVVASFAEAWIEMVIHNIHNNIHSTSPPSRRRGLKYRLLGGNKMSILSPPSRRRGLKLQND